MSAYGGRSDFVGDRKMVSARSLIRPPFAGVLFPAVKSHTIRAGPGGEIGRRKGLNRLSTQRGNGWCEWSQIRGNLSLGGRGNPELSPGVRGVREFGKV